MVFFFPPLLPPVYFLSAKFIKKKKKYNCESLSSSLENTVTPLIGCPSLRAQHKRLRVKREEEMGAWLDQPCPQGKPVPLSLSPSDIPGVTDKLHAGYVI